MNMLSFGKNDATGDKNSPPYPAAGEQHITLDINNINFCDLNPRKSKATHYDSTKASIKAIGLQTILTVTKKPGEDKYSLLNGGNTRLSILKELYEEYLLEDDEVNAKAIQFQQCIFKPYTSDLDVLVKHMAENEERSDMTFIDKARAVFQIRQLYLEQTGEESISFRQLVKHIHSLGWNRLNAQAVTELSYAYENLQDVLPLALNAGLGKPKIQKIRKNFELIRIYLDWLLSENNYRYSVDEAKLLYLQQLSEHDDDIEPINVEEFFEDYLYALSDVLMKYDSSLKVNLLQFELENIENYGEVRQPLPPEEQSRMLVDTASVEPPIIPAVKEKKETFTDDSNFISDTEDSEPLHGDTGEENTQITFAAGTDSEDSIYSIELLDLSRDFQTLCKKHNFNGQLDNIFYETDESPFLLIKNDTQHIKSLESIILSGEQGLQYFVLHIISVQILYIDNVYDYKHATHEEHDFANKLMHLWGKYATKYNQYRGICQTGLVLSKHAQVQNLQEVNTFVDQHINNIRKAELDLLEMV